MLSCTNDILLLTQQRERERERSTHSLHTTAISTFVIIAATDTQYHSIFHLQSFQCHPLCDSHSSPRDMHMINRTRHRLDALRSAPKFHPTVAILFSCFRVRPLAQTPTQSETDWREDRAILSPMLCMSAMTAVVVTERWVGTH